MPLTKPRIPPFEKIAGAIQVTEDVLFQDAEKFMDERRRAFIKMIERQQFRSFKLHPLSPRYLAKKKAHGADTRVLIATHHYLDCIRMRVIRSARHYAKIGFDIDAAERAHDLNNHPTDIPMRLVATVLELGSAANNVPPRPTWRPFRFQTKVLLREWKRQEAMKLAKLANTTMKQRMVVRMAV